MDKVGEHSTASELRTVTCAGTGIWPETNDKQRQAGETVLTVDMLLRWRVETVDGSHGDGKPRRTGGSTMAAEVTMEHPQTPAK